MGTTVSLPYVILRRGLGAALLWSILALHASAQEAEIPFSAENHLSGYATWIEKPHSSKLIDFASFESWERKKISMAQLEELRRTWREATQRAEAQYQRFEKEPAALPLFLCRWNVEHHSFVRKIDFETRELGQRFVLVVQQPSRRTDAYVQSIVDRYAPLVERLEQTFVAEHAQRFGLERRADYSVYAILVLASEGDYLNFWKSEGRAGTHRFLRAHYQQQERLAVTYQEAFAPRAEREQAERTERHAFLHELVHALQHSYGPSKFDLPRGLWFNEGLAEYLALHLPETGSSLVPELRAEDALRTVLELQRKDRPHYLLSPISSLVAAGSLDLVVRAAARRALSLGVQPDGERFVSMALEAFYAQSTLWVCFLHRAYEGRHVKRLGDYVRRVSSGAASPQPFLDAFQGFELAGLEREFQQYLRSEAEKRKWEYVAPPAAPVASSAAGASSTAANASEEADASFDPASLACDADDERTRLALALREASEGRIGAARTALLALRSASDAAIRARAAREQARVLQFEGHRDALLKSLASGQKLLRWERGGEKLSGKVKAFADGAVTVLRGSSEVKLGLEEIPPHQWGQEFLRTKFAPASDGTIAWCLALGGQKDFEKHLPKSDAEIWKTDLSELLPLLSTAELAAFLDRAARTALPTGEAAGQSAIEELRRVLARTRGTPLHHAKCAALQGYTRELYGVIFDAQKSGLPGLHAQATAKDSGRWQLAYEFQSADELQDFVAVEYLEGRRAEMGKLAYSRAESKLEVKDGAWVGRGQLCYRHRLAFGPGTVVRYKFSLGGSGSQFPYFLIGLNDDGRESFLACLNHGYLEAIDLSAQHYQASDTEGDFVFGTTYEMELRCDAEGRFLAFRNGKEVARVVAGPRTAGGVFLFLHSEFPLRMQRFEIEGAPEPAALRALRRAWVDAEAKKLFG
ncbi:MAG: hypothetical protein JNM84_01980 [Planctomycetes bacterium]|nr:hypothetical protein [Planctomycetota bacterium]